MDFATKVRFELFFILTFLAQISSMHVKRELYVEHPLDMGEPLLDIMKDLN